MTLPGLPFRFRFLADRSLSARAGCVATCLLVLVTALVAASVSSLGRTTDRLTHAVASSVARQGVVDGISGDISSIHLMLFRYIAWSNNGIDPQLMAGLRDDIESSSESVGSRLEWLREEGGQVAEPSRHDLLWFSWWGYMKAARQAMDVASADPAMGTMMLGGADDDFKGAWKQLRAIATEGIETTVADAQRTAAAAAFDKVSITAAGLSVVALGGLALVVFLNYVVKPVQDITEAMRTVSDGNSDFSPAPGHARRRDEIGQMVGAISAFSARMRSDGHEIEAARRDAEIRNARFDAALENMSQGIAMFDSSQRLIVSNRKYAEIYRLDPDTLVPGQTTFEQVLAMRESSGTDTEVGEDSFREIRMRIVFSGEPADVAQRLKNGRTVHVSHRPMPDGGWVSTHEDITERRGAEERVRFMATHDELTRMPNRAVFREKLEYALAGGDGAVAVHCLDLDRFKAVNDTYGHPVGDLLLRQVAGRIEECIRSSDTAARFSGDEFAVLQPGLGSSQGADEMGRRLVEVLSRPYDLEGHRVTVGASVGISVAMPKDHASVQGMITDADTALYEAKEAGRGMHRFFDSAMDDRLRARREIEDDLKSALDNSEFDLHFQPTVTASTGELAGFEALLRWNRSGRGPVPPDVFIPIAEEMGLIHAIGDWVLERACRQAAGWPSSVSVAVNLSPLQFTDRLVDKVASVLLRTGLAPGRLEVEVTETALLGDDSQTRAVLSGLKGLGLRIAMDDFGTGYSSLGYLMRHPFDRIKVDKSFVSEMEKGGDCEAIIEAVADLARRLGISTTAEGVETAGQAARVAALGINEAQGYHFSRPMPASEVAGFIRNQARRAA